MFSKIEVNGENSCELYKYLKTSNDVFKKQNEKYCRNNQVDEISWNFAKFLVNKNGEVVGYFGPKVHPD